MPNYRIDRLFERWQIVNDRLVFAIAKIYPDINKDKIAYLLEKRRIELFYYSQSLIFNKLAPSEQHKLALDIHTRIPLEYSQEIESYLFK